jgi:hypothetical protein
VRFGLLIGMLGPIVVGAGTVIAAMAGQGADAEPEMAGGDEAALLRVLAERLLGPGVRLVPGATPDNLPLDVPAPPGGRLLGSVVRPGAQFAPASTAREHVEVVLEAPDEPPAVLAFYADSFARQGFTVAPVFGRQGQSGFLPSPGWVQSPLYCRSEEGPGVSIAVFRDQDHPSDVRVRFEGPPFPPCTASGPGVLPPPAEVVELPLLVPPPDAQVQPGSSGAGVRGMEALVETALSAAALEAFYAAQLEAAGWTLRERGGDGPLVWSAWLVPGVGDRQGFLSVLAWPPGQNRRHVQFLLAVPGLPQSGLP